MIGIINSPISSSGWKVQDGNVIEGEDGKYRYWTSQVHGRDMPGTPLELDLQRLTPPHKILGAHTHGAHAAPSAPPAARPRGPIVLHYASFLELSEIMRDAPPPEARVAPRGRRGRGAGPRGSGFSCQLRAAWTLWIHQSAIVPTFSPWTLASPCPMARGGNARH